MLTFPSFSIKSTSIAQPLIGSFITAGIGAPSNQPLTLTLGNLTLGSGQYDNQVFIAGTQAYLIDPGGANAEIVTVQSILQSGSNSNQIALGPKTNVTPGGSSNPVTEHSHVSGAFGVGTWILLHVDFNSIFVQEVDGNSGTYIYIGNSISMTSTYKLIAKLAKVGSGSQPNFWNSGMGSPGNPFMSSEFWVLGGSGNASDSYNVSLNQV